MEKTLFKIFDKFTEGVDVYHTKTSMWMIFTDKNEWVIELTNEGTLWYNYNFFTKCFRYTSLDVVENQHYITEWVEDTIQNGVRHTVKYGGSLLMYVEDTIQNGVRHTEVITTPLTLSVEDTIQNGVKETIHCSVSNDENSREALQNGIKITDNKSLSEQQVKRVIRKSKALGQSEVTEKEINKVIKETHDDAYHNRARVEGAINNGIKEIIELPDKSGELNGYGEYYARQKNKTYPHADIVNDVIKETKYCELHSLMRADHIIRDGIKETKRWMRFKRDVTSIVETNWRKVDNHPTYLDSIIDESNCGSK